MATVKLIDNDVAADFLSEAANADVAELEDLIRAALSPDARSEVSCAAAVLVAAHLGYPTHDADIEEVAKQGFLQVDEVRKHQALRVLDSVFVPEALPGSAAAEQREIQTMRDLLTT